MHFFGIEGRGKERSLRRKEARKRGKSELLEKTVYRFWGKSYWIEEVEEEGRLEVEEEEKLKVEDDSAKAGKVWKERMKHNFGIVSRENFQTWKSFFRKETKEHVPNYFHHKSCEWQQL